MMPYSKESRGSLGGSSTAFDYVFIQGADRKSISQEPFLNIQEIGKKNLSFSPSPQATVRGGQGVGWGVEEASGTRRFRFQYRTALTFFYIFRFLYAISDIDVEAVNQARSICKEGTNFSGTNFSDTFASFDVGSQHLQGRHQYVGEGIVDEVWSLRSVTEHLIALGIIYGLAEWVDYGGKSLQIERRRLRAEVNNEWFGLFFSFLLPMFYLSALS
ncbi:DNA ligase 1 [Striga asiatica]|uniref:DNA ligase 1 n=1 Tax=Striga asiatica TaxID=4170 RepID=A0A5A7QJI1_STRAF|nr:DNA ligase 1 [Striga asiatica]